MDELSQIEALEAENAFLQYRIAKAVAVCEKAAAWYQSASTDSEIAKKEAYHHILTILKEADDES